MRESTKQRLAFNLYVELGARRSLEALQALLRDDPGLVGLKRGPSLRSLYRWSSQLHWQDRIYDMEKDARQRDAEALVQALREMNERQAREGLLLQQKAIQRFQQLADNELAPEAAIRALAEGARLERLARGDVTERTSIERHDEYDFSRFSMAELRALAELGLSSQRGDRKAQPEQSPRLGPGLPENSPPAP